LEVSSILAALYQRERTGQGQRIDVSLLSAELSTLIKARKLEEAPPGEVNSYPDARQVRPHQFQVDNVIQDYSQATPASQTYVALILVPGDTFAQAYWNTSQGSQWHGYDQQWDAEPRYP
jgi:crotonobetainyl-CoA:carnitine CoA-transferase CaiB-like acyl-CoA transferase